MILYLQEKCKQYWPEQINVTETKGSKFKVTVTSFVPSAEYQIRKIHLTPVSDFLPVVSSSNQFIIHNIKFFVGQTNNNSLKFVANLLPVYLLISQISEPEQELTVTHMFYTVWPDHGVPHNTMSLISFIRRVRKEHPTSLTTPLLVHCSAGVGRTGTFILLDLAMQQMRSQGTLSVFQLEPSSSWTWPCSR